jgi:hypothetical protein
MVYERQRFLERFKATTIGTTLCYGEAFVL